LILTGKPLKSLGHSEKEAREDKQVKEILKGVKGIK